MRNFFRRIPWKGILAFILIGATLIGAAVGISSAVNNKEKKISATVFARGAIDEEGQYVKSDRSIYTKDLIECQGLRIEPDFEATGTYQVFYYAQDKTFLGATELLDAATDGIYNKLDAFSIAKYCRVMITPDVPKDEDGYIDEDFKIRFYNVTKYAKEYSIYVNKNQTFSAAKIVEGYDNKANVLGEGIWDIQTNSFKGQSSQMYIFDKVDVTSANYLVIKLSTSTLSNKVTYSDGQIFSFPYIYNGVTGKVIYDDYTILDQNSEFSYIMYDVSSYTSVFGVVDINSSDVLEIYSLG